MTPVDVTERVPRVKTMRCRECAKEYAVAPQYVCEFCFGPLEVIYDYEAIAREISREKISARANTIWRYRELLPVEDTDTVISLGEGFTPLIHAGNFGRELGLERLYLKNDCANPTHSFKDRVVSVAVTRAKAFGFTTIACASTGNLANAVSAYGARAGLEVVVFIPHDLEAGKVLMSNVYQPTVIKVNGNYDDVNRLCSEVAGKYQWAFANINMRPFYSEGSKTLGYETAEQLGWSLPDHVVIPVASGSLLTKMWKSFHECVKVGLVSEEVKTRVHAAQAEGCSPITTAWKNKTDAIRPVKPKTIAKSLAIGNPADGYYALQVLRESGGGAQRESPTWKFLRGLHSSLAQRVFLPRPPEA